MGAAYAFAACAPKGIKEDLEIYKFFCGFVKWSVAGSG